jgi:hypothetical protein
MASSIAKAIADKIDITEDYSIDTMQKRFTARLRVVKPDFRF